VSAVLAFEQTPETDRGRLLYQMLLTVHAGIRGELARVERLAVVSSTAYLRTGSTRSSRP
jgi:hypothetical protein